MPNDKRNNGSNNPAVLKLGLLLLFLILLISSVYAIPPQEERRINLGTNGQGYDVVSTSLSIYLPVNISYKYNVHVYNISNGMPIVSGIACYAHIYERNGSHLAYYKSTNSYFYDYNFTISGNYFYRFGYYNIITFCNDSNYGGFVQQIAVVTPSGNYPDQEKERSLLITLFYILGMSTLVIVVLLWLANMIVPTDWYLLAIKLFCVGASLVTMIIPLSAINVVLSYSIMISQQHIGPLPFIGLRNISVTALKVGRYALWIILALGLLYFIWYLFNHLSETAKGKSKKEWQP